MTCWLAVLGLISMGEGKEIEKKVQEKVAVKGVEEVYYSGGQEERQVTEEKKQGEWTTIQTANYFCKSVVPVVNIKETQNSEEAVPNKHKQSDHRRDDPQASSLQSAEYTT